jgi:phenylpropionate dioxygenase-like ring-hydroxylating dioxygenase large terminal subunit
VWPFVCSEDHIPDVGDYMVYEIAGKSFLVGQNAPETIKACWNPCLHHAHQLKDSDGQCVQI